MPYIWRIALNITECTGIQSDQISSYAIYMTYNYKKSHYTQPKKPINGILQINTEITIEFETQQDVLRNKSITLTMLKLKIDKQQQQIYCTSAINHIHYPYSYSQKLQVYRFTKSLLDKNIAIKAYLTIYRDPLIKLNLDSSIKPQRQYRKIVSLSERRDQGYQKLESQNAFLKKLLVLEQQECKVRKEFIDFIKRQLSLERVTASTISKSESFEGWKDLKSNLQNALSTNTNSNISQKNQRQDDIEALIKQRNELYEISQQLYKQLKKCKEEREIYLLELRQKQLNQDQIRQEVNALKLRIDEYQTLIQQNERSHLKRRSSQNEDSLIRAENQCLINENIILNSNNCQLQRKVKECLRAIQEFRNDALQVRYQLINKQQQLQKLKKNSFQKDIHQVIQILQKQVSGRKLEPNIKEFIKNSQKASSIDYSKIDLLKTEIVKLFTNLTRNVKIFKERDVVFKLKSEFQSKMEQILSI